MAATKQDRDVFVGRQWILHLTGHVRHNDRFDDESAISLVEMIIAIFILGVSLVALAGVAGESLASVRGSRDREQAINAATGAIEDVRSRAWEDVVLAPSVAVSGAPSDCWEGEPLVRDVSSDAVPHEQSVTGAVRLTVRTYVTWADASCASGTPKTTKRVVAIVSYVDPNGGATREVRQETLVAEADRGLPVPEFSLSPPEKTIQFSPDAVSNSTELCGRHQLRNLGSVDTYDWIPTKVEGASQAPFKATNTSFYTPDKRYTVRALFETPAEETADVAPATVVLGLSGTEEMTDSDGNGRPEASTAVDETGTANVWICYRPDPAKVVDGDTLVVSVEVHSRFNPNRFETVTQTVTVGTPTEAWYLYDRLDSTRHPRGVVQGSQTTYPIYTMGPQDGVQGSTDNLGTVDYADPTLSDWDSDVDTSQLPGVGLLRNSTTETRRLTWHEQFPAATTLDNEMTLELWVSTTDVLKGTSSTSGTQNLQVVLQRLHKNEQNVAATLHTQTVSYSIGLDEGPWKRLSIPLVLSADPSFGGSEFLRLRVTCLNTSAEDCHVAYDNTTYPSALRVVRK